MYLAIGMPYSLYWDGEPEAAKYYREAEQLKHDLMNQQCWLQGLYVYDAIGSLQPALNPFAKGRVKDYLSKPIDLQPEKEKLKSVHEQDKRMAAGRAYMEAFAIQFNSRFKSKQEGGGESDG